MYLINHVDHIYCTKSTFADSSGNEPNFKSRLYKQLLETFDFSATLTSDQLKKIRQYIQVVRRNNRKESKVTTRS